MDKSFNISEITLRDIISAIFRKKTVIIITIPIIVLTTLIGLLLNTPVYEAYVKMYIKGQSEVSAETYRALGTFQVHVTQMEIVKSNPVIYRAVKAAKLDERPLDYEKQFCHPIKKFLIDFKLKRLKEKIDKFSPEELRNFHFNYAVDYLKDHLSTALIPHTDLFFIKVRDYSPESAIAIANIISRSYTIFDQQQQIAELEQRYGRRHPSVQQLRDNIYRMSERLSGDRLPDIEAIGTASVKIIEQGYSNHEPLGRSKRITLVISFFASIFIGIGLAILFDFSDQTFKSPNDIVKFLGLPLLGSILKIKNRNKILIDLNESNPTETQLRNLQFYEDLADQLYIYMKVNNFKTILFTSALPNGGITTICTNISICLSQLLDHKTLLIDANLRNPSIHKAFQLDNGPGLANMLEEGKLIEYHGNLKYIDKNSNNENNLNVTSDNHNNISEDEPNIEIKKRTNEMLHNINPKLDILLAGKASVPPVFLLKDKKFEAILKLTKLDYEVVIIDCSNLKEFKDTGIISTYADGVVLVVNERKERRQVVLNSLTYLKQKKINPVGIILNRRKFSIPKIIYKWL